ncbi:hypothetical protein LSTR_LSTR013210 [Laodelphax striatellus]|uniref:Uncharacterized protein n=1 Tax=Laodelphax striatellus TaxID=195883 RepID=A0A482X4Y5_LAOST|nr:hypothetical protein LSTR_LSTR013210 [Laodelphax striatellus]
MCVSSEVLRVNWDIVLVGLKEGSEMYIPTMIHHSAVTLEGFFGRNADSQLTLQANAPEHFVWTAGRLGLQMPHCEQKDLMEATV